MTTTIYSPGEGPDLNPGGPVDRESWFKEYSAAARGAHHKLWGGVAVLFGLWFVAYIAHTQLFMFGLIYRIIPFAIWLTGGLMVLKKISEPWALGIVALTIPVYRGLTGFETYFNGTVRFQSIWFMFIGPLFIWNFNSLPGAYWVTCAGFVAFWMFDIYVTPGLRVMLKWIAVGIAVAAFAGTMYPQMFVDPFNPYTGKSNFQQTPDGEYIYHVRLGYEFSPDTRELLQEASPATMAAHGVGKLTIKGVKEARASWRIDDDGGERGATVAPAVAEPPFRAGYLGSFGPDDTEVFRLAEGGKVWLDITSGCPMSNVWDRLTTNLDVGAKRWTIENRGPDLTVDLEFIGRGATWTAESGSEKSCR